MKLYNVQMWKANNVKTSWLAWLSRLSAGL